MVTDPRATGSASVTEVDFRRGQSERQEAESEASPGSGRDLQLAARYDDFAWQATALETPSQGRNRLIQGALAVVAVVGFTAVIWFAYHWGLERGYREEVPIVRADAGPIKIRPEDPGGLVVPNQDKLVLNQAPPGAEGPSIERLLSAPEAPQPLPELAEPSPLTAAEVAEPAASAEASGESASADTAATDSAAEELAAELPAVPAEPAPAGDAPADEPVPSESTALLAPPDVAPSAGGNAPAGGSAGGAAPSGTDASSAGLGEPSAGALQLAAIKEGDYVIQLASVTSDEAAKQEWTRLQKVFPALLGDMNLSVQVATVKGVEYHRIQTGPFPSRATAFDLCAQIKAKNQACIVQRR